MSQRVNVALDRRHHMHLLCATSPFSLFTRSNERWTFSSFSYIVCVVLVIVEYGNAFALKKRDMKEKPAGCQFMIPCLLINSDHSTNTQRETSTDPQLSPLPLNRSWIFPKRPPAKQYSCFHIHLNRRPLPRSRENIY